LIHIYFLIPYFSAGTTSVKIDTSEELEVDGLTGNISKLFESFTERLEESKGKYQNFSSGLSSKLDQLMTLTKETKVF